jgi:hypothetical protein
VGLAVADQDDKKKRVNEVDTWQLAGKSKFLSPSDILGFFFC